MFYNSLLHLSMHLRFHLWKCHRQYRIYIPDFQQAIPLLISVNLRPNLLLFPPSSKFSTSAADPSACHHIQRTFFHRNVLLKMIFLMTLHLPLMRSHLCPPANTDDVKASMKAILKMFFILPLFI